MPHRELSLAVVGLQHPNARGVARKFEAIVCVPGEPVHLVPETKNKHDPQAVAVFSDRGIQLGYLSAERCGWVGGMIGRGEEVRAIFQSAGTTTAVIRVAIGGADPVLPPPPIALAAPLSPRDQEPEWYPDYAPPDDHFG
ncbi:MAG: hypothetical protein JWM75_1800 [Sphingomonas bacterium]|nr:hypothetical protein [Sphingomonas bacterium]